MSKDQEEQFIVWQRYVWFKRMGMKESYMILFNGWLIMDYVLANRSRHIREVSKFFLSNEFLE